VRALEANESEGALGIDAGVVAKGGVRREEVRACMPRIVGRALRFNTRAKPPRLSMKTALLGRELRGRRDDALS
jgi:hypothetical protein